MCLMFLLMFSLYIAVVVFFKTAQILLPWTITATVLAGLATLAVSRLLRRELGPARLALTLPTMVALTLCFGYMAWAVKPPRPIPAKPPKEGLGAYVELLFTFPEPEMSKDDIRKMLPAHLTVAGLLGGVIVSALAGLRVVTGSCPSQAAACDSGGDVVRAEPGAAADGGPGPDSS